MENILIPSALLILITGFFTWKSKTFAPRKMKIRLYSAKYFETTSKVSREG